MTTGQASRYVLLGLAVAVVAISYRNIKEGQAPPPWELTGAMIIYGVAGAFAEASPEFATFLVLAYTVGVLYVVGSGNASALVPGVQGSTIPQQAGTQQEGP